MHSLFTKIGWSTALSFISFTSSKSIFLYLCYCLVELLLFLNFPFVLLSLLLLFALIFCFLAFCVFIPLGFISHTSVLFVLIWSIRTLDSSQLVFCLFLHLSSYLVGICSLLVLTLYFWFAIWFLLGFDLYWLHIRVRDFWFC